MPVALAYCQLEQGARGQAALSGSELKAPPAAG